MKRNFPDATTTVCVLLCKNDGKEEAIKIAQIKSNEEIDKISDVSNFYQREIKPSVCHTTKSGRLLFYHYSLNKNLKWFLQVVSIWYIYGGIATGANDFCAKNQKLKSGNWTIIIFVSALQKFSNTQSGIY